VSQQGVLLLVCLSGLVPSLSAEEMPTANELLLTGHYDEAKAAFAKTAETDATAAIGLARCQAATGKREAATATLMSATERFENPAQILAELALLAFERGDHEEAGEQAAAALGIDKDCVLARWVEAELLRTSGEVAEAQRAYAWFIGYHNRAARIDDPWDYVWIGRAVAQHARWTRNNNQFRRLVSDFYPAALRLEPNFWPAHLEAARLFAEKFNEPDAAAELSKGLAINPQAAELHAAKAALALDKFDLPAAEAAIVRALEINEQSIEANCLLADCRLADVRAADAIESLDRARQLNPRDEPTLGRLLAVYIAIDGRPDGELSQRAAELVAEASKHNAHCGEFFLAAAESFDRMRRFSLAAEYYRAAHEALPQPISVRGDLGLVLMRLGEEPAAAKLLEESFAIDPFNVRVKNMLEVLDVLQGYAVLETEHFVIKFDRGRDELLATCASRYLENEVYPQITKQLGFAPPEKTLIEIFSRHGNTSGHSWFSARMVGLPFIGTVGACAGKMVALASPDELPEKYNWATVLRHEFVHVVNLQQTDFHVPHWLTEGIAVHLEDQPRPAKWTEILAKRARADDLFDLDDITFGFIRPKSSDDWTLAYCQSELYVEYLQKTYGEDAIARLLAAYADRCSTAEALLRCFDVSQADFETGYRKHLESIITGAAGEAANKLTLAELQRQVESEPENADTAAALALAWLDRDDKPQARRLAVQAQKLQPKQPLAAYVLARVQLSIGDTEAALALLEAAHDSDSPNKELLTLLAALKLKAEDWPAAEALYQLREAKFPGDDVATKALARIYLLQKDNGKLLPVLKRWSELDPDNIAVRKKLAQLALDSAAFADAAAAATSAIHLDVQDAPAHALLAAALAGQDKLAEAAEEYQVALRIESRQADWQAALAAALIQLDKPDKARKAIDALRDLDPNHPQLKTLTESLPP
jgi:Flp pilus assembly protein TadD